MQSEKTLIIIIRDLPRGTFRKDRQVCVYCALCGQVCIKGQSRLTKDKGTGVFIHKECREKALTAAAEEYGWKTPQQAMAGCQRIVYATMQE